MRSPNFHHYINHQRCHAIACIFILSLTYLSGCAEIPISEFSRPNGIGKNLDQAQKKSDIFFFEDFESDDYQNHFHRRLHRENLHLATGKNVFNGKKSLRITIDKGEHNGGSLNYRFADSGMTEPSELYARYYLRFDESWKIKKTGGKLPGPAGRYDRAGWGGRKANGTNGWSARMRFGPSWAGKDYIDIGYYTYHKDMRKKYGEVMPWDIASRGSLQKNRWYCIETYVKLNDIGKSNGILRGWVDGHLAMEEKGLNFRTTADLKIEEFWVNVYYGGNWTAPRDMHLYIDNLALSTSRIGTAIRQ